MTTLLQEAFAKAAALPPAEQEVLAARLLAELAEEQQTREEEAKLALLRSLASEGFHELDAGQGIVIEGEQELSDFISRTGRRAAEKVQQHSHGK